MKKFLNEFKAFAMRGNVVDMAVGVIIGAAFKAIVDSLVSDIISPAIGVLIRQDFSSLSFQIPNTDAVIGYGAFITAVINFVIMAFVIFCIVKALNAISSLKKPDEAAAPKSKKCPYCINEIAAEASKCPHCTSDINC